MLRRWAKRQRHGSLHFVKDEICLEYVAPASSLCSGVSFCQTFRRVRVVGRGGDGDTLPSTAWTEGVRPLGPSPSGSLRIRIRPDLLCPGFSPETVCVELTYIVPSGIQHSYHPKPGAPYEGTRMPRVAYLPNTREGRRLLWRLKFAFSRGLTFRVGRSDTTHEEDTVVWTKAFPHKTSLQGGEHGFPDPHYLVLCHLQLDKLGGVPRAPLDSEEEELLRNVPEELVVYTAPIEWVPTLQVQPTIDRTEELHGSTVVGDAKCSVCFERLSLRPAVQLAGCMHAFHQDCATASLGHSARCPICRTLVGAPQGRSPSGTMTVKLRDKSDGSSSSDGGTKWVEITYNIPSGMQSAYHDNPGAPFGGTLRKAYLPHTDEGCRLLTRLRYSWMRGLTFTVGKSLTTGARDVVTWTSIPHKTSLQPGDPYGLPDPSYCSACHRALDSLGVPDADACLEVLHDEGLKHPDDALDRQLARAAFVTYAREVSDGCLNQVEADCIAELVVSDRSDSTTAGDVLSTALNEEEYVLIEYVEAMNADGMKGFDLSSSFQDGNVTETTVDTHSTGDSVEALHVVSDLAIAQEPPTWENSIAFLISEPLVICDDNGAIQPVRKLAFGRERKLIWRCLERAKRKINLYFDAATHSNLLDALARGCRCLHYSGHGHPEMLFFESHGMAVRLPLDLLRRLVFNGAGPTFQLVFISACSSFTIGQAMASAGVQHVVCCDENSELKDEAALAFTEGFYYALACGTSVKMAFEQGRKSVLANIDIPDSEGEMGKFVLLGDGDHNVPVFDSAVAVPEWPDGGTAASVLLAQNKIQGLPPPSPPRNFMGRDVDMYSVLRRVLEEGEERQDHRKGLVTVLGEPGVGCSSLARALCQRINERASTMPFCRIFFAEANEHDSDKRVFLRRLSQQLHEAGKLPVLPESCASVGDMADAACTALRASGALVVFDGVALDPNDLSDLQFCRFLRRLSSEAMVLVTSRMKLGIVGEKSFLLQPLTFGYTVRLFASSLPSEFSRRERRKLFDALVWDQSLENLRITDPELKPATAVTFHALGAGVPGKIEQAAHNMPRGDVLRLVRGAMV